MGDIIIRYVPLPASIKAYTLTDDNDDYNVYVNSALNSIEQKKALQHELRHIEGDHFFRGSTVASDEKEAESTDFTRCGTAVKVRAVEIKPTARKDLRRMRLALGLTQYQAAKLAGIRPSLYAEYEQGSRECNGDDERKIISALAGK